MRIFIVVMLYSYVFVVRKALQKKPIIFIEIESPAGVDGKATRAKNVAGQCFHDEES